MGMRIKVTILIDNVKVLRNPFSLRQPVSSRNFTKHGEVG